MRRVGVDTETTGLSPWTGDRPFAVGMCFDDGETRYWEWPVDPKTRQPMVDDGDRREVARVVGSGRLQKEFWNLKFDVNMLRAIGIEAGGPMGEGTFMAKACNNLYFSYQLKPLSKRLIDFPDDDEKDLQEAVVKCRRVAKKLGWNIAQGKDAVKRDYWLPRTLCVLAPRIAAKNGLTRYRDVCRKYCVKDAERTILLCTYFRHGMADLGVEAVYEMEMQLLREVTIPMERRGVIVDRDRMRKVRAVCRAAAEEALEALRAAAGREDFNPDSSQQMVRLLFDGDGPGGLRLPVLRRSRGGKKGRPQPKVDAEALAPHQLAHPLVEQVFRYRANTKALTSFFAPYERFSRKTRHGMTLHTTWNQWGALTGRFTSQNPSFQVVPNPKTTNSKAAKYVVDVRQVFVPRAGHVWYCPDYSQVEVIIFADIAGEEAMLRAIRAGENVHTATTNAIWGGRDNPKAVDAMSQVIIAHEQAKRSEGKDWEDYDRGSCELRERAERELEDHGWDLAEAESELGVKIYRKLSKSATFTKIFGGGPNALMGWIGCTRAEAVTILNQYDEAFPDMAAKMRLIERQAKLDGYVTNPFGRRLVIDRWYSYRAVNYLVQSAAADLMKRGMLKCTRMLGGHEGAPGRIVMTIHDELIFEFLAGEDTPARLDDIRRAMSDHEGVFRVPTPVDMDRVTERWSAKETV